MTPLIATLALVTLTAQTPGAPGLEGPDRFQKEALLPAMQALAKDDRAEASRLARVVAVEFDKLPALIKSGQVGDLQRLSRLYMEKGLAAEAESLLARAVAEWEGLMLDTPFSPLGPLYADLAKARRLLGRLDNADALLQRAQKLRGSEPTPSDPDAYPIFVEVAELRRARGDLQGAEALLVRMVGYADRMKGWEYVPNLIGVFDTYAAVLEQTGRGQQAKPFRARAAAIRRNYSKPLP